MLWKWPTCSNEVQIKNVSFYLLISLDLREQFEENQLSYLMACVKDCVKSSFVFS